MILRILAVFSLLLPFFSAAGELLTWFLQREHWLQFLLVLCCQSVLIPPLVRRGIPLDRWTSLLLLTMLAVLSAGIVRGSVWLQLSAWCFAAATAAGALQHSRRGRLLLVLLVTLPGPPPAWKAATDSFFDNHLLQTAGATGTLLEIWHFRVDRLLVTTHGSIDAGLILDSPLGLSGTFAVVAGLMLYFHRPAVQILLMLPFTAGILYLTQTGCCVLALFDVSDGSQWVKPQYWPLLALPLNISLLWSALHLKILLTHGLIPPDRDVSPEMLLNPCNRFWDRFVGGRPAMTAGPIRFWDSEQNRFSPAFRPAGFLKDWLFSRRMFLLPRAAPAIAVLFATPVADLLIDSQQVKLRQQYKAVFAQAETSGDDALQEICLQQLASAPQAEPEWQLKRARFLFEKRDATAGWNEYLRLASLPDQGLADAHLWLAQNALSPNAVQRISEENIVQHLQKAVVAPATRAEAHALLGSIFLQRGDVTIGEQHLRAAADADLKYVDALLLQSLRHAKTVRPDLRTQQRLQQLRHNLQQEPKNSGLRIHLAVLLTAAGNVAEAEDLIQQGRSIEDTQDLQKATADLLVHRANKELSSYFRTGDGSLLAVREALRLSPGNAVAAVLASQLTMEGADLRHDVIEPIAHWKANTDKNSESVAIRALAHLSFASHQPQACLDHLNKLPADAPDESKLRIAALMLTNRQNEAGDVARHAAAKLFPRGGVPGLLTASKLLCLAGAFEEAELLLDRKSLPLDQSLVALVRAMTALDEIDFLSRYPGYYGTLETPWTPAVLPEHRDRLLTLIRTALPAPELSLRTADRLFLLTLPGSDIAPEAESLLRDFQAAGGNVSQILMATGTRAIQVNRFSEALRWLLLAEVAAEHPDAVLSNNLALAIVRAERRDLYSKALTHADHAIRLMPGNHQALATRGEVYLAIGNPRLALVDLQNALALRPDYVETLQLLARCYEVTGDPETAEKYHQQAKAIIQIRL